MKTAVAIVDPKNPLDAALRTWLATRFGIEKCVAVDAGMELREVRAICDASRACVMVMPNYQMGDADHCRSGLVSPATVVDPARDEWGAIVNARTYG